eukprot:6455354-Pyramimonas_sp.AAC.1
MVPLRAGAHARRDGAVNGVPLHGRAGHGGVHLRAGAQLCSRWINRTQGAWVHSHDGPIGRRARRYVLTMDQSDAGRAGILSRWTNQTQGAWVYSHDGPIGRRARGYILTMDQSDAGAQVIVGPHAVHPAGPHA